MTRTIVAKIGKTITYWNAAGKPRPARVTSIVAGNTINLKIKSSGETFASVPLATFGQPVRANVWTPE